MPEYRWNTSAFAEGYDEAAPTIHPHYIEIQDALIELLESVRKEEVHGQRMCVLDLGGGSGRLVERILERLPTADGIVLDQSEPFLGLAERRLERFAERVTLVQARLQQDWCDLLPRQPTAIVSMSAIHHLDPGEKSQLYEQAFGCLGDRGILVNGDEVQDSDPAAYLANLQAWSAHMDYVIQEGLVPQAMQAALRGWQERNVINCGQPKVSGDDCHESIEAQLGYLGSAGFSDTAVLWQRSLWAVLVAKKSG